MSRRAIVVVVLAVVHYLTTVAVVLRNFGIVMRDFDNGGQPQVTLADRVFELLQPVLFFPLVAPLGDLWPRMIRTGAFPLQHVPFIANAMLWAFTIVAVFRLWRGRAG